MTSGICLNEITSSSSLNSGECHNHKACQHPDIDIYLYIRPVNVIDLKNEDVLTFIQTKRDTNQFSREWKYIEVAISPENSTLLPFILTVFGVCLWVCLWVYVCVYVLYTSQNLYAKILTFLWGYRACEFKYWNKCFNEINANYSSSIEWMPTVLFPYHAVCVSVCCVHIKWINGFSYARVDKQTILQNNLNVKLIAKEFCIRIEFYRWQCE